MALRTTDNNCGKELSKLGEYNFDDLSCIANKNLCELEKSNSDLLIFPQSIGQYHDDIEKSHIFSLDKTTLTTYNLMGFIGRNSTQLTITSRFAQDDLHDYFLHYMLQKVFSINLLDFEQTTNDENIWDFMLYLFPYFLKKSYSQGLYKAYKREEYNDANLKGAISVKRHICTNIPFAGRIAYTMREYSYDNNLNQLIRHTIEYVKSNSLGRGILNSNSEVRSIVNKFCFVTQKSYNKNLRQKIIYANLKPVSHPFFTEYKLLQKICLQILRREKLSYGKDENKIYGLLFDGAWLWEEYLNTILKDCGFDHPLNKESKGAIYLFKEPKKYRRYPDFWKENFILDAKYKRLSEKLIDRNDMHQIISYMFVKKAKLGGFIFPTENQIDKEYVDIGALDGYGGIVRIWSLLVSQDAYDFQDFCNQMEKKENNLKKVMKNYSQILDL